MLLTGCANENMTRCLNAARLNAGVWRTLFAWLSPGWAAERRGKHSVTSHSQSASPRLGSLCPYYLLCSSTRVWKWPPYQNTHSGVSLLSSGHQPTRANACRCYSSAGALHSSGWGTILKGLSQRANKPGICLSQLRMFLSVVIYYAHI